ncbi:MAG: multidrug effflux MFS transporter [Hyphomonadaceae bacterium]|nr:multidrug effflux MFS transporter [Hyphomonadaceae bacterium]
MGQKSENLEHKRTLSRGEFCALTAYMMSLVALAIDIMLPVLDEIGAELGTTAPNQPQLIIAFLFGGLMVGQLIYGPASDTTGRKPAIFSGLAIFVIGCIISATAESFEAMLAGRFIQGLGVAGPRIVSIAIVRDLYAGRAMARITSIIMAFFILVPAIAPQLGQWIIMFAPWRMIFYVMIVLAGIIAIWYGIRQPESLPREARRKFSARKLWDGAKEVFMTRVSLWYTVAAGIIYGAFLSYLFTSPQIFEDQFGIVDRFPVYFGALALVLGAAGFVNSKLVMNVGMRKLCRLALTAQAVASFVALCIAFMGAGSIALPVFLAWGVMAFFTMGLLFGNFNAIAMEPLGHIAGIGSAFVSFISTGISLVIGQSLGWAYNETVYPLLAGFFCLAVISIVVMRLADRKLEAEII